MTMSNYEKNNNCLNQTNDSNHEDSHCGAVAIQSLIDITTTTTKKNNTITSRSDDGCRTSTTSSTTLSNNNNNTLFISLLNMNVIDGIRCLSCFCVVLFHVHYVHGGPLLLRESSCSSNVASGIVHVSQLFFRVTWHMTLFWILSGFLCEYQLHQLVVVALSNHKSKTKNDIDNKQIMNMNNNNDINNNNNMMEDAVVRGQQDATPGTTTRTDDPNTTQSISLQQYYSFLINRFLRLFPLYCIGPICAYFHHRTYYPTLHSYTLYDLIATLLFVKQWEEDSPVCASIGWTVQIDVHGYIALLFLFATTYKFTYCSTNKTTTSSSSNICNNNNNNSRTKSNTLIKRCIVSGLYLASIAYVIVRYRPLPWQQLSKEGIESVTKYGVRGIDTTTDTQLILFGIEDYDPSYTNSNHKNNNTHRPHHRRRQMLYPTFDFDSNLVQSIRLFRNSIVNNTYFASIFFNHGSSVFLGSLLYMNLYERNGISTYPFLKICLVIVGMILTRGWHTTSGIFMYLLMDVFLTIRPYKKENSKQKSSVTTNITKIPFVAVIVKYCFTTIDQLFQTIMGCIVQILSHSIFKIIAPYTYAIYLFHMFVIMKRYQQTLPARMDAILSYNIHNYNNYNNATASTSTRSYHYHGTPKTTNYDDACIALMNAGYEYNIQFVFQETIITLFITSIMAYIIHWTIEQPILSLRKKRKKKKQQ